MLGLGTAADGDEVFRSLVLARIIEPASKLDSLRVLEEAGAVSASYRTVLRRLLPDVTVVADAGMIFEADQKAIEAAGLSFILGMKIPDVPCAVAQWRREHPGKDIPDGHVFTQPWPAGPKDKRRYQVIYYSFKADRARRTLHGIDEQVAKAAKAVADLAPVKRNRFIALDGAAKSVNREQAKARDLAGLKGYITNLAACPDGTRSPRTS